MILLGLQALLCAQVACAQVLKFSLRWENSPLSLQNSTPRAIELAYRYANQFRWSTIDSFQAKPCPCSSPVPSSPCGDITINLASNGVNVTRPVQFRWLQRGPPSPSVWSVDTISIRGSIYDDFDDQLYPNRKRWCDISGGVISASNCSGAPPHHNSLQFCSGCVRESVGVLTPLLVASGLVIILQPCRRDLDVLELTETPIDSTNCSNDVARTQILVEFVLFIGLSNGSLDMRDAIQLSMRDNTSSPWIPLSLYASGELNYPGCGPDDCRIAVEGYNVSVKINRSMAVFPLPIQIRVCGLLDTQLQLMWSGGGGSKVDWALGNLNFTMQHPSQCALPSDKFYPNGHTGSILQEVQGGTVQNISDPNLAIRDLSTLSFALEVSETVNLIQALTEVLGNYSANEEFGQRFISIASNVVSRAMQESQARENLDGSEFLQALDHFALWNQNVHENISTIKSENILLNISSAGNDLQQPLSAISCGGNSITLPGDLFSISQPDERVRVVAYCYNNISQMLHDPNSNPVIGLPVLSATLNCTTCIMNNTTNPVVIVFEHPDLELLGRNYSTKCAYWHFMRAPNGTVSGRWSPDGCVKNGIQSSSTTTVCFCYHLTHFAILLSPGVESISKGDDKALYVIEVMGAVISLIALAATVFTYALLRPLWSLRSYVHVNLCLSLFASQLLLLSVEEVKGKVLCAAVAVILQYLFLVVFMWMLMEGVVLYLALVVVFMSSNSKYMALFAIISYGLPAVYLSIIVPVGFLVTDQPGKWQYGTSQSCWLRYDTHFVWSFIAPVLLILIANVFIFMISMSIMWRHHHSKMRAVDTKHWLRVSISLTAVLGFTWVFGVLYFNKYLVFFAYIFTICNTLQGLFIFIFSVMLSKQVRDEYRRWWDNRVIKFEYLHKHFGSKHSLPTHMLTDIERASSRNKNANKTRTMSTNTTRSYPDRHMSVTEVLEDPSPRRRSTLGSIGYDVDMEVFEVGSPNACT
eukprot:Em0001g3333a